MILENCINRHKNLSRACIDYKKAFGCVQHSWIPKTLQLFKFFPVIQNIMQHCMNLAHSNGIAKFINFNIDTLYHSNGTFQS